MCTCSCVLSDLNAPIIFPTLGLTHTSLVIHHIVFCLFIPRECGNPINVLTGLDYWLDNLMCNVPEVAMCYHLDGIVQV